MDLNIVLGISAYRFYTVFNVKVYALKNGKSSVFLNVW